MFKTESCNKSYPQDGCEPDSSSSGGGRRQMCEMATQTSTVELPRAEDEKINETDDEKKRKEVGSNGNVAKEKKKGIQESEL